MNALMDKMNLVNSTLIIKLFEFPCGLDEKMVSLLELLSMNEILGDKMDSPRKLTKVSPVLRRDNITWLKFPVVSQRCQEYQLW